MCPPFPPKAARLHRLLPRRPASTACVLRTAVRGRPGTAPGLGRHRGRPRRTGRCRRWPRRTRGDPPDGRLSRTAAPAPAHLGGPLARPGCGVGAAEVAYDDPLGGVLLVHHKPSWPYGFEAEREAQARAAAVLAEEMITEGTRGCGTLFSWATSTSTPARKPGACDFCGVAGPGRCERLLLEPVGSRSPGSCRSHHQPAQAIRARGRRAAGAAAAHRPRHGTQRSPPRCCLSTGSN